MAAYLRFALQFGFARRGSRVQVQAAESRAAAHRDFSARRLKGLSAARCKELPYGRSVLLQSLYAIIDRCKPETPRVFFPNRWAQRSALRGPPECSANLRSAARSVCQIVEQTIPALLNGPIGDF